MNDHEVVLVVIGDIFTGEKILKNGAIIVKDQKILKVVTNGNDYQAKKRIDASNKLVMPGVIDSHVHSLSYPGEGFENSTKSASAGGVTTIVDMPVDAPEGITTAGSLKHKIDLIDAESHVDVALLGSIKNQTLNTIKELKDAGVCGYKISLFDTDPDRFPRVKDGELFEALKITKETGLPAGVHAENNEIIKYLIKKAIDNKQTSPRAHCETRPPVTETESVLKGMEIARATGARFHLYHISCHRSVQMADYYRQDGCDVTVETCPHYLLFTEEDMDRLKGRLKINPPVRQAEDCKGLWTMLEEGKIDTVSSDHAPWPAEFKDRESIFDCAAGAPGVELLLPLIFSEGVVKEKISLGTLYRVLSLNPAKIFGLYPRKGSFNPGSDADMVIIDSLKKWTVSASDMHTTARWSPYEGMELTGKVEMTIVRGQEVFSEGNFLAGKGFGEFVRPVNG